MDQRVGLVTERLDVIADLLAVLKDQLTHGHGEMLEWIGMLETGCEHPLLTPLLIFFFFFLVLLWSIVTLTGSV